MPYVTRGKIYSDPLEDLQLSAARLVFRVPGRCTGRVSSDEKTFKIFSDDKKVSCFVLAHGDGASLPADWLDAEFTISPDTLRPVSEIKRGGNETHYRFFEGATISACKMKRSNRNGLGLHASAAAEKADAEQLRNFVKEFVPSLRRPRATASPSTPPPSLPLIVPPARVPPPAPMVTRDQRLRGLWYYSPSIRSGSASMTTFRFRYFAGDGRFAQGGESYATFVQTGSGGQWAGMDLLHSRVPKGERGTCETARGLLTLNYEDNMCSEFSYYIEGNDLLLQQRGRDNQLWTRG